MNLRTSVILNIHNTGWAKYSNSQKGKKPCDKLFNNMLYNSFTVWFRLYIFVLQFSSLMWCVRELNLSHYDRSVRLVYLYHWCRYRGCGLHPQTQLTYLIKHFLTLSDIKHTPWDKQTGSVKPCARLHPVLDSGFWDSLWKIPSRKRTQFCQNAKRKSLLNTLWSFKSVL